MLSQLSSSIVVRNFNGRLLKFPNFSSKIFARNASQGVEYIPAVSKPKELPVSIRRIIGYREVVGFGMNGQPMYTDSPSFPMPSIRWREPIPEIQALKEREKGDWKLLTKEEKKKIYRSSFRHTYEEFMTDTGEWMGIVGTACILISAGLWIWIYYKLKVYGDLPMSFHPCAREQQIKRMLRMENNPITGIASHYDYENNKWKSHVATISKYSFPEGLDLNEDEYQALMKSGKH